MTQKTYEERLQELQLREKEIELRERELNIATLEKNMENKPKEIKNEQTKEVRKACTEVSATVLKSAGKFLLKFAAGCLGAVAGLFIVCLVELALVQTVRPGGPIIIAIVLGFTGGWKLVKSFTDKKKANGVEGDDLSATDEEKTWTFSADDRGNDSWICPTNLTSEEAEEVCRSLEKLMSVDLSTIVPNGAGENDVLYRRVKQLLDKTTWQERNVFVSKFPTIMHSLR